VRSAECGIQNEKQRSASAGAFFAAVLCALLVGGCESELPEDVAKLAYVNRAEHFAMDVPQGWTVRESSGAAVVLVTAPAGESEVRPNLTVIVRMSGAASLHLGQEVAAAEESLKRLPGFRLISEGPTTIADGRAAWTVTFVQEATGQPLLEKQLYVLGGQRTYIVTATASPETFIADEPNFDVCFRSFRVAW